MPGDEYLDCLKGVTVELRARNICGLVDDLIMGLGKVCLHDFQFHGIGIKLVPVPVYTLSSSGLIESLCLMS